MTPTVSQLEKQLTGFKEQVKRRDDLIKLCNSKLFKELILEEFSVKECATFTHTSADPNLKAEERADALAMAQSAGHLRRWISVQLRMGDIAEHNMRDLEETIEQARQEEENGGDADQGGDE